VKKTDRPKRRVRPLLLVLLWVWAITVFVTVDLFRNVPAFDRIRPRAALYRGMREAGHELVGEPLDGNAPSRATTPLVAQGGRMAEPDPVVDELSALEGVVLRPDGTPAANARLLARDHGVVAFYPATAGEDGRFRIAVPRGRVYEVAAACAGCAPNIRSGVLPPARVTLVLAEGGRVVGRAIDRASRRGVADVVVRLEPDFAEEAVSWPERDMAALVSDVSALRATTDAEGAFLLDGVLPGAHYAVVVAGGPVRVGGRGAVSMPGPAEVQCDVTVDFAAPVVVTGRVHDADAALAGVEVRFGDLSARTTADGSFVLEGVPQGPLHLEVFDGGVRRAAFDIRVPPDPLDFLVPAWTSITGRVVGPDDHPIAETRVLWIGLGGPRAGETDADGAFRFERIPPDDQGVVRARAPGFAAAEGLDVLRLEEGGRIEGAVFGPDGAPAAGVPVVLLPGGWVDEGEEDDMDLVERLTAVTDARGAYAFEELPPGAAWVYAVPSEPLAPAGARCAIGRAPDLRLGPGRTVKGEVTDEEGRPVAGAVVRILSDLRDAEARTDDNGRFAFAARPATEEEIVVTQSAFAPAWATTGSDPLLVRMARTGG